MLGPSSTVQLRFPVKRAGAAIAVIALLLCTLLGRVWWLETDGRAKILDRANRQQEMTERLPARRGSIFDSTGQLLAGSIQTQTVFVDPKEMIEAYDAKPGGQAQLEKDIRPLAALLDEDPLELVQQIGDKCPARYLEIANEVSTETLARIQALKFPGVGIMPHNERQYPMGSLAAHILGGVGADGKGLEGLEMQCNELLSGIDGSKRSMKDSQRRAIGTVADDYRPPQHGQHLVLTIDANIQLIVEQELAATVKEFDAPAGEVVVMNPNTGEIVALANYPTFSPEFIEDSKPVQRMNRALISPYEPGSTIKPYIVSRALNQGEAKLTDIFHLGGSKWITPYGRTITDVHGYDSLALWDVLVKSSNIGMSQLGEKLGNTELRTALANCGFGKPTGIDLPGEGGGVLKPLRKWGKSSTESISQGYELLVTPLQMARAMSTIANGGKLVTPTVIKGTLDDDGTVVPLPNANKVAMAGTVISSDTAASVRRVLADVPVRGTATKARSMLYNIFGKTGTAHRAVNGHYDLHHYTSSFVGGAPFESPRLVIAFVVHDPDRNKAHYGGIVAAPGASRILDRALQYMQVPMSPDLPLPPTQICDLFKLSGGYDAKVYDKTAKVASARE